MGCFLNDNAGISQTALHLAAERGLVEIAQILLLFGAQLEALDDDGRTSLMLAVCKGKVETVRVFFDVNGDTTKSDREGLGVSLTQNKEIKELLLEHAKKSVRRCLC